MLPSVPKVFLSDSKLSQLSRSFTKGFTTSKWLLVCSLFVAITFGCERNSGDNPYYWRTKGLADMYRANPSDRSSLDKLIKYAQHSTYWNRIYAYGYLAQLAEENTGNSQAELISIFDKALLDKDQTIQKAAVEGIRNIGSKAVNQSVENLLLIVRKRSEDDVGWLSVRALGEVNDPRKVKEILAELFKLADTLPPAGTPPEAPQLRYEALDAISELSRKNGLDAVPGLEALLNRSQTPYKRQVAETILRLNPNDEAAKTMLTNTSGM